MRELTVQTERRTQLVDITRPGRDALDGADGAAAALVYVPHTTAGLTINEHADPAVARDFERALERIVADGLGLGAHRGGRGERALAHPRRADGPAGLIPLEDGELALGTWQGIFFCEFDGPREPHGLRHDAALIEVEGLTKRFGRDAGGRRASASASSRGTITGFLGPNGAGKTTTLRSLLGLVHPDAGTRDGRSACLPRARRPARPRRRGARGQRGAPRALGPEPPARARRGGRHARRASTRCSRSSS